MRHDPIDPGRFAGAEPPSLRPAVRERMTHPAVTIQWDEPVARAWALMQDRQIRHLPVLDAEARLVGVLSDGDVREALEGAGVREASAAPATLIVGKAMTVDAVTVTPGDDLAEAVVLMRRRKLSCLPVMERDRVAGILTASDILDAFVQRLRR